MAIKTSTETVGQINPIELPVKTIVEIQTTLGEQVTYGNIATIYKVKGCTPSRLYKVIPLDRFKNGDEVRISQKASDLGVAPRFHSAFLVKQPFSRNFVVIEMDDAGKTMGNWMEDLAPPVVEENQQTDVPENIRKILEELKAKHQDPYQVTEIKTPNRITLKEAIVKMYPKPENFYCQLFDKIKKLAENNIAYGDTHVGNIIPNIGTGRELQLIDFGSATLTKSPEEAETACLKSAYNRHMIDNFLELTDLSEEGKKWTSRLRNPRLLN